jgi:phage nucleotide-binding protein
MAKKTKTNPTTEDIDLDSDSLTLDDELVNEPVATAQEPPAVMDYSIFEEGIQDITLESEEVIKALLYGPNGSGKNTIAATFPGPSLVLDLNERGTRSMVGTKDIKKRFIDTFDLFQMSYWYLRSGNHPYKTVILDNVTTLQELAMRFVMGKEQVWDSSKDMDMPTKRDWGGLSQIMKRWLIDFRNLPMNVVFIAQERKSSDDDLDSDEISVFPQVSGSVRAILGAAVDVIGNTFVKQTETEEGKTVTRFCMRITPDTKHMAKIRLPVGALSPTSIVNPSYAQLKLIMNGDYQPKKKK